MFREILKMLRYFRKFSYKLFGLKMLHVILTIALFFFSFLMFHYGSTANAIIHFNRFDVITTVIYTGMVLFFFRTYKSYLLGFNKIRMLVFGQFLSQLISVVTIYIIISLIWNAFKNPAIFILMLGLQFVLDMMWSILSTELYFKLGPKHKTLLVYRNQVDKFRISGINGSLIRRVYTEHDELQFDGTFHELREKLEGYDTLFVAGLNSRCRNGLLKYCRENNVDGYILPHIGDTIMMDAEHITAFDAPVLHVGRKEISPGKAFMKRVCDILSSGILLTILSPIMLVIALVIKTSDNGPIFCRDVRLTRDGREFEMIKFRTTRVKAEKNDTAGSGNGNLEDDETTFGKFLSKWRIDEIPELINVFKGDMSMVGPKPEKPEIAAMYVEKIPAFRLRQTVKAGIIGYTQIYGGYDISPYEELEFDLLYIKNMNVLVDMQLFFASLLTIFKKEYQREAPPLTRDEVDQEQYYSDLIN